MELRWRTVVVTGVATPVGREVVLRLARLGAGVVAVDPDADAAAEAALLARERRVAAWAVQADVADAVDRALLAARVRDLGGADAVVLAAGGSDALVEAVAEALAPRAVLCGAAGADPGRLVADLLALA